MRRSQRRHDHRYHAYHKGNQESEMHPVQESGKGRWELAHTPTVNEHLHHSGNRHGTQSQGEDDSDTEHLSCII